MIVFLHRFVYHCFMQEREAFIALLNAKRVTEEHWNNLLPQKGRGHFKASSAHIQEAQQLLQKHLSAWIESGFRFPKDDIEKAEGEKELSPMPPWATATKRTLGEEPKHRSYETWECEAVFKAMEGLLNCTLHVVRRSSPPSLFIFQANYDECQHPRGLLSVIVKPSGGIEASPGLVAGYLNPDELAAWAFFIFWKSPWLFILMRCARCGIFAIPDGRVRKSYKRGWHCARCRNSASARAATAEYRKVFRRRWFGNAVNAYLDFERRSHRAKNDKVQFITKRVNESLPALYKIKRNTITHNLAEIQAAAEGRSQHAKG